MVKIFRIITVALLAISSDVIAGNTIALIGDNYREQVFNDVLTEYNIKEKLTRNERKVYIKETGDVVTTLLPSATNIQIANQLRKSSIALVVVDSTIGPLPIDRDHIIIARQARVPVIAILLANLTKLHSAAPKDALELLELEELEMKALLSNYEVGGDSTLVFYDRKSTHSGSPLSGMGIGEIFKVLSKISIEKIQPKSTKIIKEFRGSFYLLSQAEANNKGVFLSKNKKILIWSEGTDSDSSVISDGNYKPGEVTDFNIMVNGKLLGYEGSRLILVDNGNLVGIGVIANIHR